jgi:hypothetical protein
MSTRSSYLIVETNIYKSAQNGNENAEQLTALAISEEDFKSGYKHTYNNEGNLVESRTLCNVYFQHDGYPQGHPMQTAEWLERGLTFNGASCLAASFVSKFKDGWGGVYIHHPESFGNAGEDYLYKIEYICDYSKGTGTKQRINFECLEVSIRTLEIENGETDYEEVHNPVFSGLPIDFVKQYKRLEV